MSRNVRTITGVITEEPRLEFHHPLLENSAELQFAIKEDGDGTSDGQETDVAYQHNPLETYVEHMKPGDRITVHGYQKTPGHILEIEWYRFPAEQDQSPEPAGTETRPGVS